MGYLKSSFNFILICALVLLYCFPAGAQGNIKYSKKIRALEKSLQEVMELSNCPGMSVVVVKKDQIIYANGFGYSDYENKKPVTANTLFPIASCTKAFTAALIGQLEAREKLDLDERPVKYLPQLEFYNPEMNQLIKLRDLLAHRTGLSRHDLSWYLFPTNSRDSLVQRIKYMEPTLEVRQGFQYNNLMYMVAGAIAEKLSGKSWEENVSSSLFAPLDMTRSNLSLDALLQSPDIAYGYALSRNKTFEKMDFYDDKAMAPVGSINSNALDMGKWLIAWINGGRYKGKQVIPEEFIREAISSQMTVSGRLPGKLHPDLHFASYGFGWELSSYRGHYRVEHGGNIYGFSASTAFYPSDSIGIAVLVNRNFTSLPGKVRNIIVDKLLGLPDGKWYEHLKKQSKGADQEAEEDGISTVSNRITGTQPSHSLQNYTGKFTHPGYGKLRIILRNDSLVALFPESQYWLRHNYYDVFEPNEIKEGVVDTSSSGSFSGTLLFNFHSNMQGEIDGFYMNAEQGLDPLFFKRELEALHLKEEDLARYIGEYDLGGAMAKVFLNEENTLMLLLPGQPEYTLIASSHHKFKLKDLDGYGLEFEEDGGKVTAVLFVQPNGTFRVPKK